MAPRNLWLVACMVVALLISIWNAAAYYIDVAKHESAVAECNAEATRTRSFMLCDYHPSMMYRQLSDAEQRVYYSKPNSVSHTILGTWIALILLGLIPHSWRFMLNRIRELGDAIRGRQS